MTKQKLTHSSKIVNSPERESLPGLLQSVRELEEAKNWDKQPGKNGQQRIHTVVCNQGNRTGQEFGKLKSGVIVGKSTKKTGRTLAMLSLATKT
jgi:hypothetical protein